MDQSTLDKLRKLHLKSMAASYETQDPYQELWI